MKAIRKILIAISLFIIFAAGCSKKESTTIPTQITFEAIKAAFGDNINLNSLSLYASQAKPAYIIKDNTSTNTISNIKATIGRVLFYDKNLSINDNEITLWIQKQILNKSKFSEEVITAFNGLEGLEYFQKLIYNKTEKQNDFPGLILLDLHMPVMDGWEFLCRFSSEIYPHCKNTKVIITSYSIDEVDSERAKEYPFVVDFLTSTLSVHYLESLPR